jgi:hypothetical protein
MAFHELKRFEEALASHDRAIELRQDFADAHSNRGNALRSLKRFDEALTSFEQVIALAPDQAVAHSNRAIALHELKRFDEALASHDRAVALGPDCALALSNRGITLYELKRFDEALASYQRARVVEPDFADAHHNEAHCRMLTGDLLGGLEENEWRWKLKAFASYKRDFVEPLWLGADDIAGKTLLIHADHGFGDTIHFCRYVPLAAARGARVILELQKPLRELMTTLAGGARIVAKGEPLPDFDLRCPVVSLPLAFRTELATIPSATPYLQASPEAVRSWSARLGPRQRPRIGIAWSGDPMHSNDHNRSIALEAFLPLLAGVDATFVSLHRDVRAGDVAALQSRSDLVHFGEDLKDYSDTAALIANLDLVIAVDTSVVHLAGALAKPVWILVTFVPDWRWFLDRDDSPWYPTVRLFRQDKTRNWDSVIARVNTALADYVRGL